MASTTQRGDEKRSKRPAAQSDRAGPDPVSTDDRLLDKDLPDDGGTETDRGAVVKRDRNFDSGPPPGGR